MSSTPPYKLVRLANGTHSVHSLAYGETFHPVIGPVAEAEALYVRQLKIPCRLRAIHGEFVVWDVGLGAAANVLTVLKACRDIPAAIRIVSFDQTLEPLEFASKHAEPLGYFIGYEQPVQQLLTERRAEFRDGALDVSWEIRVGDFPALIRSFAKQRRITPGTGESLPTAHAVLFDAFSPAKNPAMWTLSLFSDIFQLLSPNRPCALATYSRSTMLRVSLLLAGFSVGSGHATGEKEETTIAANAWELLAEPLDRRWLWRARQSTSAEPLDGPRYRQAPLSPDTWQTLQEHPQFRRI